MPTPIHTPNGLAALGRASSAGMRHTARRWITDPVRQPLGEYVATPRWGPEHCAHLKVIGSALADIAAARGIEAQWSLKVPSDTVIPADSVWQVTADCGWSETVRVTGDLVKHGRVMRLVAAVDTTLNRP